MGRTLMGSALSQEEAALSRRLSLARAREGLRYVSPRSRLLGHITNEDTVEHLSPSHSLRLDGDSPFIDFEQQRISSARYLASISQ